MSNKIYLEKPISELPEKSGWYVPVYNNDQIGDTFIEFDEYWLMNRNEKKKITHWLKSVTLPELLAEHPEIITGYLMISPLIDELILKTPTGLNRNKLCGINIIIKAALLGGKLSSEPTPSKTADEVREESMLTVREKHEIIDATIGKMGELEKTSVKYFLEAGSINGSFRQRLYEIMGLAGNKAASAIYTQFTEPRDRELERLRKESTPPEQKEAGSEEDDYFFCQSDFDGGEKCLTVCGTCMGSEQAQQPGSGEVESLKYYNERLKSDIQLMYVGNKKLCDQLEPLQRENDRLLALEKILTLRIELSEAEFKLDQETLAEQETEISTLNQQLSDKDKEIAQLKGAENPLM